jgi:outer membrane protein assembly factor BamE (lipoprotein component of BamABCDE complex)
MKTKILLSKSRKILVIALLLILAVAISVLVLEFRAFSRSLESFAGLSLGTDRDEVLYRLGHPDNVIDLPEYDSDFGGMMSRVYDVDEDETDVNGIPEGKTFNDYHEWVYLNVNPNSRLSVTFDSAARVESLNWYAEECGRKAWEPVAGIRCNDSENEVFDLGKPTFSKIHGTTKTIRFDDIGLKIILTKGRVYMIEVNSQYREFKALSRRFLVSIF